MSWRAFPKPLNWRLEARPRQELRPYSIISRRNLIAMDCSRPALPCGVLPWHRFVIAAAPSASPAQQVLARPGTAAVSFGGRRLRLTGGRMFLFAEQPSLQPVQVDVDNRRRIESENLRQG